MRIKKLFDNNTAIFVIAIIIVILAAMAILTFFFREYKEGRFNLKYSNEIYQLNDDKDILIVNQSVYDCDNISYKTYRINTYNIENFKYDLKTKRLLIKEYRGYIEICGIEKDEYEKIRNICVNRE